MTNILNYNVGNAQVTLTVFFFIVKKSRQQILFAVLK